MAVVRRSKGLSLLDNYTYGGGGLRVGYASDVRNLGVVARGNSLSGGARFNALDQITFTGNTLIAPGTLVSFQTAPKGASEITWDRNTYLRTKVEWAAFTYSESGETEFLNFAEWQKRTGFDAGSSYEEAAPRGSEVIVLANRYEKGRAHIVVFNWERFADVEVNLNVVVGEGQRYRIVSAQNISGDPLFAGTWTGDPIRLSMQPTNPVQPVGMPDYELPVTEPEFGVFLVLPARE